MNTRAILRALPGAVLMAVLYLSTSAQTKNRTDYTLKVEPANLSSVAVRMDIPNAPKDLRVAMAVHPEYNDRYWRFVEEIAAESHGKPVAVRKVEENIWKIDGASGTVTVKYRVRLPEQAVPRASWKPFLTPTGGMVGDLHMLMYVVGAESRHARLKIDMPVNWQAASGLEATSDPHTFTGSTELVLDSPVMVGQFSHTRFEVAGVPHSVVIWSPADAKPYDALPLVSAVKKIAEQSVKDLGPPPYPRYAFMFQNGGQAGLEHFTSVNVGLSNELPDVLEQTAHEYVHVWNLLDVKPPERVGIKSRFADPATILWWNEGATLMFADLILRRAGLPGDERPRLERLQSRIAQYINSPGYSTMPAELISKGDSHPSLLGNNAVSTHLQGEVLATLLDLKIRDATNAMRGATDVMRLLAERYDSNHGVTNADIERAITDVCRCDVSGFFRDHIYGAKRPDFDQYLGLIGMRHEVSWSTAVGPDGKPAVDLRVVPLSGPVASEDGLVLRVTHPESAWAQAGLQTGDKLVSVNGKPVDNWADFRNWLRSLKIGDTARLVVIRDGVSRTIPVEIKPYAIPAVRFIELPNPTLRQRKIRDKWVSGS